MPEQVRTRLEWQRMALRRVREAKVLLANAEPSGAYYLAGLAVEFALKAALAKRFKARTWPERELVREMFTHDFVKLMRLAELDQMFAAECDRSSQLELNWKLVRRWTVDDRYKRWNESEASDMLRAIDDSRHGVLRCLRRHW